MFTACMNAQLNNVPEEVYRELVRRAELADQVLAAPGLLGAVALSIIRRHLGCSPESCDLAYPLDSRIITAEIGLEHSDNP